MHTISEIKEQAAQNVPEINWDKLVDLNDFEKQLRTGSELISELEMHYTNLLTGNTTLTYEEIEHFRDEIAEELYASYILQELLQKYVAVRDLTAV